ncbi:hypothetical protein SUDANB95_03302 [Actinosynnema sp. ALI-1.44]
MRRLTALTVAALATGLVAPTASAAVIPKPPPLTTPWTGQVSTTDPLPEYPRPQMTRPDWQSLNGEWEFLNPATDAAGNVDRYAAPPLGRTLPERVLVPYPIESGLSGIMRNDDRDLMFYRRTFTVPAAWNGRRVQLHFGAVDYEATVWVNGAQVTTHRGGYDRFEVDITAQLRGGANELVVRVYDPTDGRGEKQPVGKQVNNPGGIFYTPSSGIWHAQIAQFETEAREIVDEHRFSPAVITYVPFNEGWGEWDLDDTRRITTALENHDPTRLMNPHSGYNCCASKGDPGTGDVIDWHVYTGPDAPRPSATRVSALGEFGGIGLRDPGHEHSPNGQSFAYEQVFSAARLNDRYTGMVRDVRQLMTTKVVSAYVYTEITDVEGEYNGLVTYDRRVQKVDTAQVRAAHQDLIGTSRNLNSPVRLTLRHVRSFRVTTPGHTDRYLRHANSLARTDALTAASPDGARQDASYRTVLGLADPRCHSFESVNFPGRYLRHAAGRVRTDSDTDATSCARPGVGGTGVTFESINLAGWYLRHFNAVVHIASGDGAESNRPQTLTADSSWAVAPPWAP